MAESSHKRPVFWRPAMMIHCSIIFRHTRQRLVRLQSRPVHAAVGEASSLEGPPRITVRLVLEEANTSSTKSIPCSRYASDTLPW